MDVVDLAEMGLTCPTAALIVLYFVLVGRKVLVTHQYFRALLSTGALSHPISPPQRLVGWGKAKHQERA